MKTLEDVLENIKQMGVYALAVWYGEDLGADDMDTKQCDRNIRIAWHPAGYLGEVRVLWKGTLKEALKADFKQCPKIVSNPPKHDEVGETGLYAWGTEQSIKNYGTKWSNAQKEIRSN